MLWKGSKNRHDSLQNIVDVPSRLKYATTVVEPLYHGSPITGLKEIKPQANFLKNSSYLHRIPPLVFLTDDIQVARMYTAEKGLETLIECYLKGTTPNRVGSVYRVDTNQMKFAKVPHPRHGWVYISTDPVYVNKELRPNQNEPPLFTYGFSRKILLLCTGVLAYVFFLSWGLVAHG